MPKRRGKPAAMKRHRKSPAVLVERASRAGARERPHREAVKSLLPSGCWPRRGRLAPARRISSPSDNLAAEWRRRVRNGDLGALLEEERR